ncbi:MAG TPA: CPBP family intramembrane glutamic endopeptidase [Thermoanaerobaculia bacterium]|nr:CPBP family intramembrane glutamic endopeptidase [Thermoanaerobaculia bacterium]
MTLLIAVVLFVVATVVSSLLPAGSPVWLPQVTTKLVMLLEAFALMLLSRRPLADFGFRRGEGRSKGAIAAAFALGAATTIFVLASGLEGLRAVMKDYTFLQVVLGVWIVSSVVEEIFVRGWLQTTIARQGASPRAEVLISGAMFGALHLSLLRAGVDIASVATVVTATFLLGLICAVLRQRTRSLAAPTFAHIAFNIGGMFGGIIWVIVTKMTS